MLLISEAISMLVDCLMRDHDERKLLGNLIVPVVVWTVLVFADSRIQLAWTQSAR